ncbi:hypothetical protein BpHYR1_020157 [Brachionus plicatilis]|uniref:Uncharacterized protein n=1 Tax=Brachionus plicatilis TaxID=10195 RepID=A0A3M7PXN8_BRAPC|nr:hypothetical protein BpHYR1_020157 [Brachionus plicatilis]
MGCLLARSTASKLETALTRTDRLLVSQSGRMAYMLCSTLTSNCRMSDCTIDWATATSSSDDRLLLPAHWLNPAPSNAEYTWA